MELWSTVNKEHTLALLSKDDSGEVELGFYNVYRSGHVTVKLDRKEMKDLWNALGNEIGAFD
jgi:hypothetical protein